ncbi:hypothetical protein CR513_16645, partial [Mucuna pruriens]
MKKPRNKPTYNRRRANRRWQGDTSPRCDQEISRKKTWSRGRWRRLGRKRKMASSRPTRKAHSRSKKRLAMTPTD